MHIVKTPSKPHTLSFVLFFLLFYVLLIARTIWLYPYINSHVNASLSPYLIGLTKLLLWVVPIFCYLYYIKKENPWSYLKLTTSPKKGVLWMSLAILYYLLTNLYTHIFQGAQFHFALSPDVWINGIIFVGFIEEIPFRGLLFQKLHALLGFWQASMLSSLLFLLIHIPGWMVDGRTLFPNTLYTMGFIFLFGIVMCVVLKCSNSLWICIFIHSLNNFWSITNG